MSNALRYYYNIYCQEITKIKSNYKIIVDNDLYYLIKYDGNISFLKDIYDYLLNHHIYCHRIILNKDNFCVTNINDDYYILIRVYCRLDKVNYIDVSNYNVMISKDKCKWSDLWINKVDYYEYQINQHKKKYPYLYQTFNYYSGITETAIMFSNIVKNKVFNIYVQHKRIYKNASTLDYYNPLNMIKDVKVRDIAEFFKQQFFYDENPIINVKKYLDYINLSNDEATLFMARLLYPSYYYDLYDEIIQDKIDEKRINIIIDKVDEYETFLKEIYAYLRLKYPILEIEWLTQK